MHLVKNRRASVEWRTRRIGKDGLSRVLTFIVTQDGVHEKDLGPQTEKLAPKMEKRPT